MFYSTMIHWPTNKIQTGSNFDVSTTFYNPHSMTYLVTTEQVPVGGCSSIIWPNDKDLPESVDDAVREHSIFTDTACIYMSLSNKIVEEYMIPVGTMLYIDIEHDAVPANLKNGLVCTKILSEHLIPEFDGIESKKMKKEIFMAEFGHRYQLQPLIECMLIYELPDSVLHIDTSKIPHPVWVSIVVKTSRTSKEKRSVRHIAVPTRAIVDVHRLHVLGILPVLCQKYN